MRNGEHIIINKKDFGRAYGVWDGTRTFVW
jgi:hypothetical protein